jgi:hypothetical protein
MLKEAYGKVEMNKYFRDGRACIIDAQGLGHYDFIPEVYIVNKEMHSLHSI